MKAFAIPALALLWLEGGALKTSGAAQGVPSVTRSSHSPEITIHSSSDLVLVDVIALEARNTLPDKKLRRDDFQVFDDGHAVSIQTFDRGTATRPLALWFVVQCSMPGYEKEGSGFFRGQIALFEPALKNLDKQDTVAVAHWCDDGQSKLDLLPTTNVEDAAASL